MPLILEQSFPLGRFHATRWNQSPIEDPYGEWPPSPWRLLRALAARWFQYRRETGDSDEALRDRLLSILAQELPAFRLPESTCRGVPLRQYHPTGVTWSDAQMKNPGYKRPGTTLIQDHYRAIPPGEPVYWVWERTQLPPDEASLLHQLLKRILYFGRAESYCRFRILEGQEATPNCRLGRTAGTGNPVLVPEPGRSLDLKLLLSVTDSDLLRPRRIPPGTAWFYAQLPPRPTSGPTPEVQRKHPAKSYIQFAVGGRVYPPVAHWVKLTERFRDEVIRQRCLQLTGGRTPRYGELTHGEREALSLLRGIDGAGDRIDGAATAFFALIPDADGQPTHLVCWRTSPFLDEEIDAFLAATERPFAWERGSAEWQVRLVPLPFSVRPPVEYWSASCLWEAITPFVLPSGLHRFRPSGRPRPGETPDACLRKLVGKAGLPLPTAEWQRNDATWVTIHEPPQVQKQRLRNRGTRMLPGYRFRLRFSTPVEGPICVGHSCHFGLGLFRRSESLLPDDK